MIRLRLLALNEYGSGVILIESACHIGWCVVGRQAIWKEGMLVLNLQKMGAARTSQFLTFLTYHIQGWMIYLVEASHIDLNLSIKTSSEYYMHIIQLCESMPLKHYTTVEIHQYY